MCDNACFEEFKQKPTKYLNTAKKNPNDQCINKDLSQSPFSNFCMACNILVPDSKGMSFTVNGKTQVFCSTTCQANYKTNKNEDVEILGTSNVRSNKNNITCSVCKKTGTIRHEIHLHGTVHKLCSNNCFFTFSKQNKLAFDIYMCEQCGKPCQKTTASVQSIQFEGQFKLFCSIICLNVFKTTKQKIVACTWCHSKKSNFDMVERVDGNNHLQLFCSLNCLSLYRVNLQATSQKMVSCDQCSKSSPAQYHLTMSDASVRNFCSYNCVVIFQKQFIAPSSNASLSTNQIHQNVSASGMELAKTNHNSTSQGFYLTNPSSFHLRYNQSILIITNFFFATVNVYGNFLFYQDCPCTL